MATKSTDRLVVKVSFRLTEEEADQLNTTAEFLGCRNSDVFRMGLSSVNTAVRERLVTPASWSSDQTEYLRASFLVERRLLCENMPDKIS